ncbi:MAG: hypothetical protein AAGG50_17475 [Bacteroidota bacterium]
MYERLDVVPAMNEALDQETRAPKYAENAALVILGLCAVATLYYQLPRWALGLDPTFVHPSWIEQSPFPLFYHMAAAPPWVWIVALGLVFACVFQNYGWRVARGVA